MQLQHRVDQLNRLKSATEQLRQAMFAVMETGGYVETIDAGGRDFDRLKRFLAAFQAPIPRVTVADLTSHDFLTKPNPWVLPMFPGLAHQPFREPAEFAATAKLEAVYPALREEAESALAGFETSAYGDVTQAGGKWWQGHATACGTLHHGKLGQRLPVLSAVVRDLPDCCSAELGTSDCYYSVLDPGASINAHASSDNLKVRYHLGLVIPAGQCAISVGGQTRGWEEGKVLILEDAFIHMAWNRTQFSRVVALIDFWHPDLTAVERAALTAAFKRSDMRRLICYARSLPGDVTKKMARVFEDEDDDPMIAPYWPRKPSYAFNPARRITD